MKVNWIMLIALIFLAIVVGGTIKLLIALVFNKWFWVGIVAIALTHLAIKADERNKRNCKKK